MTDSPAPLDELPPAVSHRMDLPSITDFVDQMMARIPETVVLNMADHQQRNHLRSWMTSVLSEFLSHTVWSMQKGADRGIEQVANLIRDPDYYRTVQRRRGQDRERHKQQRAMQDAARETYRQERQQAERDAALDLKAQIDAGKVRLLNTTLNVAALPDDDKGPTPVPPTA